MQQLNILRNNFFKNDLPLSISLQNQEEIKFNENKNRKKGKLTKFLTTI